MKIRRRLSEWKAILGPPWKWTVIICLTILGAYQTIQQQFFFAWPSVIPIPNWAWFLIIIVAFIAVLEGAYRRIMAIRKQYGIELLDKPAILDIKINEAKIDSNGVIIIDTLLKPSRKMSLLKIELKYDNKLKEGLVRNNKLPHYIKSSKEGTSHNVEFKFFENVNYAKAWVVEEEERIAHGQERINASLQLTADGREWQSNTFAIPTKIKERPFVLQYKITKIGNLMLAKEDNNCKMVLPISVEFSNLDTRDYIEINTYSRIIFDTFLSDGSMTHYSLQNRDSETIKLEPGENNRAIRYEFVATYPGEPELGEIAYCQLLEFPLAKMLKYHNLTQPKANHFEVKIVHNPN